jgi:hypothetical protein
VPDLGTTEDPENRNPGNPDRSHTIRRITVITAMVAIHLVGAELVAGTANAAVPLSSIVTVSVNGATGWWTPHGTSAAVPATTAQPTTAQPAPTPEQPNPTTATESGTNPTTSSVVDTPPVPEPTSQSGPAPTTQP